MVIKTKEDLEAKLAEGWKISKKGKYYYVQIYDTNKKRVLTEKISDDLKKEAEKLYHMQKLGMDPEDSKGGDVSAGTPTKAEKAITRAVEQKIVQHAIKQIDKRTKYLILWGEWVENNILPLCSGDTFDDKAEEVIAELERMLELYLKSDALLAQLQKLKSEVEVYKTIIEKLKKKVQATQELKDLIVKLADKNPKLAAQLVDQFMLIIGRTYDVEVGVRV